MCWLGRMIFWETAISLQTLFNSGIPGLIPCGVSWCQGGPIPRDRIALPGVLQWRGPTPYTEAAETSSGRALGEVGHASLCDLSSYVSQVSPTGGLAGKEQKNQGESLRGYFEEGWESEQKVGQESPTAGWPIWIIWLFALYRFLLAQLPQLWQPTFHLNKKTEQTPGFLHWVMGGHVPPTWSPSQPSHQQSSSILHWLCEERAAARPLRRYGTTCYWQMRILFFSSSEESLGSLCHCPRRIWDLNQLP